MDFAALLHASKPQISPALHPSFVPAVNFNRNFCDFVNNSSQRAPLVIGLERGDQSFSVYRTQCLDDASEFAALNLPYVERMVKTLLWQKGGWRVIVGGPASVGEHIQRVYSPGGPRTFDADFMANVYEHPVHGGDDRGGKGSCASEGTVRLGGHLEGCRIGFDLGASDRKVAAVKDGEAVYTEEVVWDPRNATDPAYHFDEINAALKTAAKYLPRVDAVGGSAAGVYINNRPRVGSLYRGVPKPVFDSRIRNLFIDLQTAWGGIPFAVVNDGEVTALAGALSLDDVSVLGMALGSSEAGGYVTPTGELTTWLNELAFCPVDFDTNAPMDEWSGDRGVGANYFSQQAVFRLAPVAGIALDSKLGLADKLKSVQELLHRGDERARQIFDTIGCSVGYGVAHYADFYELRHVLILGRVTSGEGGNIILARAQEVLKKEFPQLAAKVAMHLPDESTRRVGQAVAAASLPLMDGTGSK